MEILTGNRAFVPTGTDWKKDLKRSFRDLPALLEFVETPAEAIPGLTEAQSHFPLFVTRSFAERIRKNDPFDPLLLQVVPRVLKGDEEQASSSTFDQWSDDPVGDQQAAVAPGLLHKYQGRVLMVLNGVCAIHCRYCFRQHYDYSTATTRLSWSPALEYIENDSTISEVILSGGDPLLETDSRLIELIERLEQIAHVKFLRIHSRVPIVLPNRLTDILLDRLRKSRLMCRLVVHSNHANELSTDVEKSLDKVRGANIPVLNQTVLLNGVNDSADELIRLSIRLVELQVQPYYVHLLDKVIGAESFLVSDQQAISIAREMHAQLPGYAMPKFVKEIAGKPGKTVVA